MDISTNFHLTNNGNKSPHSMEAFDSDQVYFPTHSPRTTPPSSLVPTKRKDAYSPVLQGRGAVTSDLPPMEKLSYEIYDCSGHSSLYHPRNIRDNRPHDQSSRWSSPSNNQAQFITIKLDKLSIVQNITFGKYHKVHVCNLKEFRVYGGLTPDNMNELLHSGLKNDCEPETFPLKHMANSVIVPCQYIKIVPLMAWGANFNYSIWYVELNGISDPSIVQKAYTDYQNFQEIQAIKLCLKHFRQRNYMEEFQALQQRTQVQLEDPLLTRLHEELVSQGNFEAAESIMLEANDRNLFEDYIGDCAYQPFWKRIEATSADGDSPCMRGGHQMCIDIEAGKIYLMGGWSGVEDLADFWVYDIQERTWFQISYDTREQGGPSPRSCHKLCLDPVRKQIYVLGRYVEEKQRADTYLNSDFYRYDIIMDSWVKLSNDTKMDGGPELIYDHQMCIDSEKGIMYVFGGRVVSAGQSGHRYSGLYTYDINSNSWRLLRMAEGRPISPSTPGQQHLDNALKSRIGHSMLYDSNKSLLYILAGQRGKDHLSDLHAYDLNADVVREITRDYTKHGGPEAGHTQRATLDQDREEIYVLSGLMRDRESSKKGVRNSFWVYSLRRDRWSCIYQNGQSPEMDAMRTCEPVPRYAHQIVYNSQNKVHYLFGGNPGEAKNTQLRLDDFWELHLIRPSSKDILRRAQFQIREQQFRELAFNATTQADRMQGLDFLQTRVSAVVNNADEKERAAFHSLVTYLFMRPEERNFFEERTQLFEKLLSYFPEGMKEPKASLVDAVKF
ncbi:uncharacterized protein VTP21DRAFT_4344 [Calcarisporiella thermophila]|uniref:uncharacterized protein n=1 Tax=Calcarisporiella thermophila TaxID=911321 RepID=UPI003742AB61